MIFGSVWDPFWLPFWVSFVTFSEIRRFSKIGTACTRGQDFRRSGLSKSRPYAIQFPLLFHTRSGPASQTSSWRLLFGFSVQREDLGSPSAPQWATERLQKGSREAQRTKISLPGLLLLPVAPPGADLRLGPPKHPRLQFYRLPSIISSFWLQSLWPEVNNYSVFMDLGPFCFNLAELFPT